MIYVNQVLQNMNDLKRIRIIEIKESYVYVVNIDAVTSMPQKELYSSILTDLNQRELITISDPFFRIVIDGDLTKVQIQKRDEDWNAIQTVCLQNMNELLEKRGRETKIKEIASQLNVTATKVKKLLSRYWQRGMSKNAMLPDYIHSGGKGKIKRLTEEKIGRPRKITSNSENQTGINITEDIKIQFDYALNKYYRKSNNYSLKDVYHFILRDFYSDQYKENGEIHYRIWEANFIPTYNQFYYWFKKMKILNQISNFVRV